MSSMRSLAAAGHSPEPAMSFAQGASTISTYYKGTRNQPAAKMASAALVTLTRRGTRVTTSHEQLGEARDRYLRDHAVAMPGLVDSDLLAFIRRRIEIDGF